MSLRRTPYHFGPQGYTVEGALGSGAGPLPPAPYVIPTSSFAIEHCARLRAPLLPCGPGREEYEVLGAPWRLDHPGPGRLTTPPLHTTFEGPWNDASL